MHRFQAYLVNNFPEYPYRVGKYVKISSSHWWHFLTATFAVAFSSASEKGKVHRANELDKSVQEHLLLHVSAKELGM